MIHLRPELPTDAPVIADLVHQALGQRATTSPAARMRTGASPVADLCLIAEDDAGKVIGTLRFWPVAIGATPALQLGPLAVRPERRGEGYGRALVWGGIDRARAAGHRIVVLIGDPAYYQAFGFLPALPLGIRLPTSDDEHRFQVLGLDANALAGVSGTAGPTPQRLQGVG